MSQGTRPALAILLAVLQVVSASHADAVGSEVTTHLVVVSRQDLLDALPTAHLLLDEVEQAEPDARAREGAIHARAGVDRLVGESFQEIREVSPDEAKRLSDLLPQPQGDPVTFTRYLLAVDTFVLAMDVASFVDHTDLQMWLVRGARSANPDVTDMGSATVSSGVVDVVTADGSKSTISLAAASADPCDDICAEFRGGVGVLGTVGCFVVGVGTGGIGGLICGGAVLLGGVAADGACDARYGQAHVGCEGTGRGAALTQFACESLRTCTIEVVLRDRDKNLKSASIQIWWSMDGRFDNFSITQHSMTLTRTDAGNFFDPKATYRGTRKVTGSPGAFVDCTTAVHLFFTGKDAGGVSRVYWSHRDVKPGTGEAACTY